MCCGLQSSKGVAGTLLRISFGLALLLHGIALYKGFSGFSGTVSSGLGPVAPLGMLWSYVLPGLMIVGGALLVVNKYRLYAAWAAGLALGSIPAGMLLKPLLSGESIGTMESANMAFVWLLVYVFAVKSGSCCGGACQGGSCEAKK